MENFITQIKSSFSSLVPQDGLIVIIIVIICVIVLTLLVD